MPSHYETRENPNCPDGMEHLMPNGTWMCGETHQSDMNAGGILEGPSHEEGGIPAIVGGTEPIELEGGEYIINAQTVDVVGQQFLDELNSTQTTYHEGGFEAGELPAPSQFARGGRIPNRKPVPKARKGGVTKRVARTKPVPTRKKGGNIKAGVQPGARPRKQMGGTVCPPGTYMSGGRCVRSANQSNMAIRGGGSGAGYRKGGKVTGTAKRKYVAGGKITNKTTAEAMTGKIPFSKVPSGTISRNAMSVGKIKKTSGGPTGAKSHTHNVIIDTQGNGHTDFSGTGTNKHHHKIKNNVVQIAGGVNNLHGHKI